ncbi:hypothetical protein V1264_009628 [Littorina saxatilis]|uniref:Uncharacterized protein n=2 Tax=Littorina saxatilis TaxID=31220 RepID=A0AAN9ARY6_9CAEN
MDLYAVTSLLVLWVTCSRAATNQTLVYSWVTVEYDWPNDTMKAEYIKTKKYIVENNIVTGIKLYKDDVFLTVSRWRPGVPSTLNRVVTKGGKSVLQPYPGWEDQTVGQCGALQYVQSMEVDPNTGFIWIIDNGRTDTMETTPSNLCPPKLVVYDINKKKEVRSYTFPDDVANHTSCFLNDIVLDYVNGDVKFAYITDTNDAKLYVYDYDKDESYFFQDDTMKASIPGGKFPIDGIAMSPDFKYVYYCPLDGLGTFQIATSVLRNKDAAFSQHVRSVGQRVGKTGGITYGQRSIFYGLLFKNGVQRWMVEEDAQQTGYDKVTLTTDQLIVHDDVRMRWPDTFGWDDSGHLWFTANDLTTYLDRTKDFSGASGPNMYVWKVFVNEGSYLSKARDQGQTNADKSSSGATSVLHCVGLRVALFVVLLLFGIP